jgi:hypothetical protein
MERLRAVDTAWPTGLLEARRYPPELAPRTTGFGSVRAVIMCLDLVVERELTGTDAARILDDSWKAAEEVGQGLADDLPT